MNLDEMKSMWKQQDSNSTKSINIDQKMLTEMKVNKQIQELANMKWARIVEGVVFFIITVLLWRYIAQDFEISPVNISAFILTVFSIIGLAGSIGQIALISKVDYAKPVSELQKDIYHVCSHKLNLTKLLLMSTPFYLAYVFLGFDLMFGIDLFQRLESHIIWFYSLSSVLLFACSAWVLNKLNYNNIATSWVRCTIQFIVGERLVNMAQFINNMESSEY